MAWFEKIFRRRKKTTYTIEYKNKLLIIDEDAEHLHTSLGITSERADELMNICVECFIENGNLPVALKILVDNCKHVNEIVFSTMLFHKLLVTTTNKRDFLKNQFHG
jgi:hypothetical protein